MSSEIRIIATDSAAMPLGHYSQAVVHNGTVYLATQLGIDPVNPNAEIGSVTIQTERALKNVSEILRAAGSELSRVLRVTVYVSDIMHWDEVNVVYSRIFADHRPARGVIPCGTLHRGYQVAFEVTAAV